MSFNVSEIEANIEQMQMSSVQYQLIWADMRPKISSFLLLQSYAQNPQGTSPGSKIVIFHQ